MSCRKYPEGRWLSIRSNTNRISGIWRIQKYEIQGIDSLIHMGFETHEFVFGNKSCDQSVVGRNCLSCSGDGEWFFPGGNREIISFRFFATPSPFTYAYEPDPQLTSSSWQIKQLENKEMILQSLDEARTQIIRMTLVKFNNKRPCK
jgi:hypothetical protein